MNVVGMKTPGHYKPTEKLSFQSSVIILGYFNHVSITLQPQ